MSKVTIYTTPSCGYCKLAKKYFQDNKVEYKEVDVSASPDAAHEMMEKSGQMGVPVIIVEKEGQENIRVGFNQTELAKLLEI